MSNHVTIVVRMPEGEAEKQQVAKAMALLEPFKTGMSLEDEMPVLELIEQHEDFDATIADEARSRALQLHHDAEFASEPKSEGDLNVMQAEFRAGLKKIDIDMTLKVNAGIMQRYMVTKINREKGIEEGSFTENASCSDEK